MPVLEGLEFYISKKVGRAIMDYQMLADGDKVAVAVSGGKDSLVLLRILLARQKFIPIKYELLALHADMGYPRSFLKPLENYFKKSGVKYHIYKSNKADAPLRKGSNYFWASEICREELISAADKLGYNKIALGHHKDDIVETILINLFLQKEIFEMRPKLGAVENMPEIIRPLAYVEESMINKFVRKEKFSLGGRNFPRSVISPRVKVRKIIATLEKTCPEIKTNIFKSLSRVKQEYIL